MSVLVAVTDSKEGLAALGGASREASLLDVPLIAVNLTGSELDLSVVPPELSYDIVVPDVTVDLDEVEQVLRALEERPEVTLLVVGVRKRSTRGRSFLGSIAQRLIVEARVAVLAVKTESA